MPWGLIFIGGPLAIVGYQTLVRPLLNRADKALNRVSAGEFAEKYKRNQVAASGGNPEAKQFIEAANRELIRLQDQARLGDSNAQGFLDGLRANGVSAK